MGRISQCLLPQYEELKAELTAATWATCLVEAVRFPLPPSLRSTQLHAQPQLLTPLSVATR